MSHAQHAGAVWSLVSAVGSSDCSVLLIQEGRVAAQGTQVVILSDLVRQVQSIVITVMVEYLQGKAEVP